MSNGVRQLECIYRTKVRENLSVNVFARVEYTNGKREVFSESGSYARDFKSSRLENLSIPVGLEIEHEGALAGKTWLNTWRLSYVGDVHRKKKLIQLRAYGYRNFKNYRLRLLIECEHIVVYKYQFHNFGA